MDMGAPKGGGRIETHSSQLSRRGGLQTFRGEKMVSAFYRGLEDRGKKGSQDERGPARKRALSSNNNKGGGGYRGGGESFGRGGGGFEHGGRYPKRRDL